LVKPTLRGILADVVRRVDCEPASSIDTCTDFEILLEILVQFYNKVKELSYSKDVKYKKLLKKYLAYIAILIIIAVNGLRAREALKVAKAFYETGERVLKLKAMKSGNTRLAIIPDFIEPRDIEYVYSRLQRVGEVKVRQRLDEFAKGMFGTTLHGIRYSFVRYLRERGVSVEDIATTLGHKEARTVVRWYLRTYLGARRRKYNAEVR